MALAAKVSKKPNGLSTLTAHFDDDSTMTRTELKLVVATLSLLLQYKTEHPEESLSASTYAAYCRTTKADINHVREMAHLLSYFVQD